MLKKSLYALIVLLIIAIASLWTPDSDWQASYDRFVTGKTSFTDLPNGQRLHYRDYGNPDGEVLLMVHGTSDSLLTWDRIDDELGRDYRLLGIDLPGHGFSGPAPAADYSRAAMNESIDLLLQELNIKRVSVMGNSLGGNVAWRFALAYPQRINRLVLLNPSGAPQRGEAKSNLGFRLMRTSVGRLAGRKITPRSLIEKSLLGTVVDPALVTDELTDRYWNLLRLPGNRQALTELALVARNTGHWQKINAIKAPTLIVWGSEDQLIPAANGNDFAAALDNNKLIIYPDIGHLPMLETPAQLVADIRAFFADNPVP